MARRATPVYVAALLGGVILLGGRMVRNGPTKLGAPTDETIAPPAGANAPETRRVFSVPPEAKQVAAAHTSRPDFTASISADAAAVLAEQVALRLQAKDIPLTESEWMALASVTAHYQAVRQAYEASIAATTVRESGRYRVEVPAYPAAGDALREKLFADVRQQLGAGATDDVVEQLRPLLEGHFAGFGVGLQTIEFTCAPDGAETDYQVTRTIRFWNSVDAGERLTTRRETHFPGREDPTGHTWGPFLSLIARSAGGAGS